MGTRLTRSEQVQRNRGLVLAAARRVFLARGYAGATVDASVEQVAYEPTAPGAPGTTRTSGVRSTVMIPP
mgnify:CR=1 FL=1